MTFMKDNILTILTNALLRIDNFHLHYDFYENGCNTKRSYRFTR